MNSLRLTSRIAKGPLRRPPLNALVPPFSLLERLLRGRWWNESEIDASFDPVDPLPDYEDLQPIDEGVGTAMVRVYTGKLPTTGLSACEVFDAFVENPADFCPQEYAIFDTRRLVEGDRFEVKLAGPWNGPVVVERVRSHWVRLATLEGHMEAGWIDFGVDENKSEFWVRSTARAGDRPFWMLYEVLPIGRWVQTEMWCTVIEHAAWLAGAQEPPQIEVVTIRRDDSLQ